LIKLTYIEKDKAMRERVIFGILIESWRWWEASRRKKMKFIPELEELKVFWVGFSGCLR
jgi:hypothetical protein